MAQAKMGIVESFEVINGNYQERFTVSFFGEDVPGGFAADVVTVVFDPAGTPNQIQTAYAAAIRANALTKGFSIPANAATVIGLAKG